MPELPDLSKGVKVDHKGNVTIKLGLVIVMLGFAGYVGWKWFWEDRTAILQDIQGIHTSTQTRAATGEQRYLELTQQIKTNREMNQAEFNLLHQEQSDVEKKVDSVDGKVDNLSGQTKLIIEMIRRSNDGHVATTGTETIPRN